MHTIIGRKVAMLRTLVALGVMASGAAPLAAQGSLIGIWVGSLKIQAQSLTLVFTVAEEKGKLGATLDSPDQGAKGIPCSSVSLEGADVRIESALIKGTYTGRLSPDGKKIEGSWAQGGANFPLALEKREAAPVLLRPQEPKAPFPYTTEEVVVENKKAGIKLAGTLVLPAAGDSVGGAAGSARPFPAVVFATGSGPQNRDEELLGHKPFLVIADYLAKRGIASLRCDDRGVGKSTGDFAAATTLDFADDVEAAFEYLASRPEVEAGKVGIVGHSEGGLVAPIVASRNAKVGFVILLAGPGIKGEDLLYLQGRLIAKAQGASDADVEKALSLNERLYAIAKGPGDAAGIAAEAKKAYLDWLDAEASLKSEEKAQARQAADQVVAPISQPWFRAFLSLDPAPYLSKVRVPLLALNGSKDLQVPPKEDLAGIRAALGKGANAKDELVELPGLNHLFQHALSGSPEEYGKIEETFAPEALKAIGDFILGL
jgi:uncharacterized protein